MADMLAKRGAAVLQKPKTKASLHSIKLLTSLIYQETFRNFATRTFDGKPWSVLLTNSAFIPEHLRSVAVASFRLLMGHDCLQNHLFRIGLADSHSCVICDSGQPMTVEHLDECEALTDFSCIFQLYWQAKGLMA
ncbi:uncharacterized protein [Parasteatoda tepidariorum]|uniref:uncharacterized protein n=1 Tax=Parasteatoda tepidariorum TaxID=114398 RepID=UPI00077F8D57|nr:uncharacterized protein LOC107446468 [Parasteatoda tepidariorum]